MNQKAGAATPTYCVARGASIDCANMMLHGDIAERAQPARRSGFR